MNQYYIVIISLLISLLLPIILKQKLTSIRYETVSIKNALLQILMFVLIVTSAFYNINNIIGVLIFISCILQSRDNGVKLENALMYASTVIISYGVIIYTFSDQLIVLFYFFLGFYTHLIMRNENLRIQLIQNFYILSSILILFSDNINKMILITLFYILSELLITFRLKKVINLSFESLQKVYLWSLQIIITFSISMELM